MQQQEGLDAGAQGDKSPRPAHLQHYATVPTIRVQQSGSGLGASIPGSGIRSPRDTTGDPL